MDWCQSGLRYGEVCLSGVRAVGADALRMQKEVLLATQVAGF